VQAIGFESTVMNWVFLALLAVKLWAFIDALIRPAQAYVAAGKLTKPAWLLILGLTVASALVLNSLTLMLIGTVAAFVYILDAKPALASVTRRR
jgi:hypothetical protein